MKLLVYGGERGWDYDGMIAPELSFWLRHDPELFLVLPFEPGVCAAAWRWAKYNNVPSEKWVADVFEHDKAAGYERNKSMFYGGVDAALLFDGGFFHKNIVELCGKHGVLVFRKKSGQVGRLTKKKEE